MNVKKLLADYIAKAHAENTLPVVVNGSVDIAYGVGATVGIAMVLNDWAADDVHRSELSREGADQLMNVVRLVTNEADIHFELADLPQAIKSQFDSWKAQAKELERFHKLRDELYSIIRRSRTLSLNEMVAEIEALEKTSCDGEKFRLELTKELHLSNDATTRKIIDSIKSIIAVNNQHTNQINVQAAFIEKVRSLVDCNSDVLDETVMRVRAMVKGEEQSHDRIKELEKQLAEATAKQVDFAKLEDGLYGQIADQDKEIEEYSGFVEDMRKLVDSGEDERMVDIWAEAQKITFELANTKDQLARTKEGYDTMKMLAAQHEPLEKYWGQVYQKMIDAKPEIMGKDEKGGVLVLEAIDALVAQALIGIPSEPKELNPICSHWFKDGVCGRCGGHK